MNIMRTGWQIENLLQKLKISFDYDIAQTNSRYYYVSINSEDSFTIRVSDHGQVYGNPKFSIDGSVNGDTYKETKAYLIALSEHEKEWNKINN